MVLASKQNQYSTLVSQEYRRLYIFSWALNKHRVNIMNSGENGGGSGLMGLDLARIVLEKLCALNNRRYFHWVADLNLTTPDVSSFIPFADAATRGKQYSAFNYFSMKMTKWPSSFIHHRRECREFYDVILKWILRSLDETWYFNKKIWRKNDKRSLRFNFRSSCYVQCKRCV